MTNELTTVLNDIIGLSRKSQMSLTARALKGGEEQGELATAVLITTGEITHKQLDEAVSGEVADVIICAIDVLAETNQELNADEIISLLTSELQRKSNKWTAVLDQYGSSETPRQAKNDFVPDDDAMFEQIYAWQRESFNHHRGQVKGQMLTHADSPDAHLIWATLRWAKEHQITS